MVLPAQGFVKTQMNLVDETWVNLVDETWVSELFPMEREEFDIQYLLFFCCKYD